MHFAINLALLLACILAYWLPWRPRFRLKLHQSFRPIPGPRALPWFGPVHLIPRYGSWFTFNKWSEFGPIFGFTLFGQTHVFLAKESIASELLLARGSIYSGRPSIPTLIDSQSQQNIQVPEYLPLMSKNEHHTRQKKFGHRNLTNAARLEFYQFPSIEAKRSLHQMLQNCSNWQEITEEMTSRVACRLAWGSPDAAQELRKSSWDLLTHISPAAFLTNLLPQLLMLPQFLCPWKRAERGRHDNQRAFFMKQMREVQQKILYQSAEPSYTQNYLSDRSALTNDVEAAFAVGMLAVTAIFTISSPMQTFIRAAALHPQWFQKVQKELDSVIGQDRMPEVSDAPNLPCLRSFIKECLRWRPPIPTGIPHELERDDVFDGYFFPKGTRIHPLEYSFCRDPDVYPDPHRFNPDRWISPKYTTTYKEPLTKYPTIVGFSSFGWGKRSCVGQNLTWHELLCFCGGMAWAFDIKLSKAAKEDKLQKRDKSSLGGEDVFYMEAPSKWDESLIIVRPRGPDIDITIRNKERKETLERAYAESKQLDMLRGTFNVQSTCA